MKHANAVLVIYHDWLLPVLKLQGFGEAINNYLEFAIFRTSVDDGTALSLAGSDYVKSLSSHVAVDLVLKLAHH